MKFFSGRELIPLILAVLAFAVGAITTPFFLDWHYLVAHTSLFIEVGILAIGMTLVIVCGQIDLSVGSMLSLCACTSALALSNGYSPASCFCFGLGLGALLGGINGVLVAKLRLPSFVVTLGTLAGYRGISQILLKSQSISLHNLAGSTSQNFLWQFAIVVVVAGAILHKTVLGRWIYAVGANERAAFYSGIPTAAVQVWVFVISGLLAALAGWFMNLRLGVARYDHGIGLELDAITAVVLGGASIFGGSGTIAGTVAALLLLGVVRTEMGIANVTAEYQMAVVGGLLVFAVVAGNVLDRWKPRRQMRAVKAA